MEVLWASSLEQLRSKLLRELCRFDLVLCGNIVSAMQAGSRSKGYVLTRGAAPRLARVGFTHVDVNAALRYHNNPIGELAHAG